MEHDTLLLQKLRSCCDNTSAEAREALIELVEYTSTVAGAFRRGDIAGQILTMIATNIFRPLARIAPRAAAPLHTAVDPKDESWSTAHTRLPMSNQQIKDLPDPKWNCLQVNFELLLRFAISNDVDENFARACVERHFLKRLVALLRSPDSRERGYVKTIVHRFYVLMVTRRRFLRTVIGELFLEEAFDVYEGRAGRADGIKEALEIFGCSIFPGLSTPLKAEHRTFLSRFIMPLHQSPALASFQIELITCLKAFLEREPMALSDVVRGMRRWWNHHDARLGIAMLDELEALFPCITPESFREASTELFRLLSELIKDPKVAAGGARASILSQRILCQPARSKSIFPLSNFIRLPRDRALA